MGAPVAAVALVIVGSMVGAGILAVPVRAGLAGLIPALTMLWVMMAAMGYTGLVLCGEIATKKSSIYNYPSLYRQHLGIIGGIIATLANYCNLVGVLVAYLTGVAAVLHVMTGIDSSLLMLAYFASISILLLFGIKTINGSIAGLSIVKCLLFAGLVWMAALSVDPGYLAHQEWPSIIAAIPVITGAAHYHNILPQVCESLAWDLKRIRRALIGGVLLGGGMTSVWLVIALGVLSQQQIASACQHGYPSTIPMADSIGNSFFLVISSTFAVAAMSSACLAQGMAMVGFWRDLFGGRIWAARITGLAPPLIIALIFPGLFFYGTDFASIFGSMVLCGIFPCVIAYRQRGPRLSTILPLLIFCISLISFAFKLLI